MPKQKKMTDIERGKLQKKLSMLLIRMMSDKSHITYWDGCVPEIMEIIDEQLDSQRKDLIKGLEEIAEEVPVNSLEGKHVFELSWPRYLKLLSTLKTTK